MDTKNLGLVKAIHVGLTPPTNTQLLWYDINIGIFKHKFYNVNTATWDILGGAPNVDKNQIIPIPVPVLTLTILHTLNKYPSVTVIDTNGFIIQCQIQYDLSIANTIYINFAVAQDGFVILN